MKTTRRQWAASLAVTAAVARAQDSQTTDDARKTAANRLRRDVNSLEKVRLPMSTEPAFSFKA
jgi:hypothetical protein